MSILIVASSEPGVGKSLISAALTYRMARAGGAVTLARLSGDESAARDAVVFAGLDSISSPGRPLGVEDLTAVSAVADVVVEAPAGSVRELEQALSASVVTVGNSTSAEVDAATTVGAIVTRVDPVHLSAVASRQGVLAALAEDRVLAAPSVDDIAAAVHARWLAEADPRGSIDRVMIGTISSDAASPYFANRERKAVITRYDKTDVQLAALLTDVHLLVLTGGGEPSPYLLDRVQGTRDDISVIVAGDDTVDTMRIIEGLYGGSRFDGTGKMLRAAELLDRAGVPVVFA